MGHCHPDRAVLPALRGQRLRRQRRELPGDPGRRAARDGLCSPRAPEQRGCRGKDNAYNILGELRDLQSVTESGISVQQKCCCDILRAIDGVNYNASINACEIKTAIHAEGEATRTLLQQQENQRLRDELAQSRAANNDYMQSQYILGQLGRYYQNPPCNPCGCGG